MNDKRPSILKIIWVDYWAMLSTLIAVIPAILYAYNIFLAAEPIQGLEWYALGAVILGIAGLGWRTISVASLINSGLETKATISEVGFYRDRGFIKYVYTYEGKKRASHMSVMKTKSTQSYQVGQEVTIAVDRENPQKTLLVELFV